MIEKEKEGEGKEREKKERGENETKRNKRRKREKKNKSVDWLKTYIIDLLYTFQPIDAPSQLCSIQVSIENNYALSEQTSTKDPSYF